MNRALREGVIFLLVGAAAYALLVTLDLYDALLAVVSRYGLVPFEHIVAALFVLGASGFVYGTRRIVDLRHEVKRRAAAEMAADFLAYHDMLTRLPNRHFVEQRLPEAVRKGGFNAIFMLDIDNFKQVNDLVGHHGGDAVLASFADRLRTSLPSALAARMGGDEFLVVAAAPGGEIAAMAEHMSDMARLPLNIEGTSIQISACIGFAPLDQTSLHQGSLDQAIFAADLAMHEAKRHGVGRFHPFHPRLGAELNNRLAIERQLRVAIADDLVEAHFQPLVRLADGRIYGFEALARWQLDDGTRVPPDRFIRVAEQAGLITDLSNRLLRKACAQALRWPDDLMLAFNVSPPQLSDGLLAARILAILREVGVPPHRLSVEITESAIIADLDSAIRTIRQLRQAGVRVALDDFGTGYSSLSQLANLPFDKMKIDRQFVANFLENDKQAKIVNAIIGLGQGLGIATLAEGIESEAQFEALRALGCDLGQGFLFGEAMPAEQVPGFLAQRVAAAPPATPSVRARAAANRMP
ncbi:EAL domain-containing protein [Starkeya koreensis]|uniref:EAL domain-containing protein n=1 Tax=Ancylobacter koreensis TaxID=266121 RepID=A0ABT0DMH4_9HYPH|nr:EAL domain-containing protein [Ancylobacter koreensis]MCK0208337.1 EAL domain-containing protein [Ancylobacter koreensis]